jgi:hypothetical protein
LTIYLNSLNDPIVVSIMTDSYKPGVATLEIYFEASQRFFKSAVFLIFKKLALFLTYFGR